MSGPKIPAASDSTGSGAALGELSADGPPSNTVSGEIVLVNQLGLHARAASKLVAVASRFDADVYVAKGATEVNAKSILGVLMLACPKGHPIGLRCVGAEAAQAYEALAALVSDGFGER